MSAKMVKRILYGVGAAVLLFIGGRELLLAGLTLKAVLGTSAGLILGLAAITGAG